MPSYRPLTVIAPHPAPAGFDLDDFVAILRKQKPLILKTAAAIVVLATLVAFSLPTVYSSSAEVMLDGRKNNVTDASAVLSQLQPDAATVQNQIQILESRALADKVAKDLNLADDPEFNGTLAAPGLAGIFDPRNWTGAAPPDSAMARDRVTDNLLKHIWADANGLSTTITVSAASRDPAKATRIANALANAYVQDQVAGRHAATSQTTQWLEGRVNDLAGQLQSQEEDIQRFKARNGLADAGPGTSLVDQQMLGINTQIVQARADLDQKVAAQQGIAGSNAANTSQVAASPLITQLRTQEAELARQEADLSTRYGPLNPKLQEIQAQHANMEQKITQEVGRIANSVDSDVTAARSHLQSLENSLRQAEQLSVNQNMARSPLQALESNATSTRTTYEAFVARLRNAQDQDATLSPESRILSPAVLPQGASSPKRALIVGASLPLGLMLGVLLSLLREKFGYLLRPRAQRRSGTAHGRTARQLTSIEQDWQGPPILGELHNTGTLKAADYVIDWPASRFAHASAALVRQLESRGDEGAVIALTATEPGDAKSVVAVAIARAAARMGKRTVIIDCDPEHRTQTALQATAPAGLYEVLTGAVTLNDALVKDPRGPAFLLALKQRPAHAAAMFASPQMTRLLEILRDDCDLVILDCGLALRGPEVALIARQADATLVVSRRERLRGRSLAHATQALQDAKAAPLGLVLAS